MTERRRRGKEDTWGEKELKKTLQDIDTELKSKSRGHKNEDKKKDPNSAIPEDKVSKKSRSDQHNKSAKEEHRKSKSSTQEIPSSSTKDIPSSSASKSHGTKVAAKSHHRDKERVVPAGDNESKSNDSKEKKHRRRDKDNPRKEKKGRAKEEAIPVEMRVESKVKHHSTARKEEPKVESDNEMNYDEDFDDYEDDFAESFSDESPDGKVSKPVKQPEIKEKPKETKPLTIAPPVKSSIRFNTRRFHPGSQRAHEIRELVEFDFMDYPILELPPIEEYYRYISSFGHSGRCQVATQTKDDQLEREIQTNDIECITSWTQHPCDDGVSVGHIADFSAEHVQVPHQFMEFPPANGMADEFFLFQYKNTTEQLQSKSSSIPLGQCLKAILLVLDEEASPLFTQKNAPKRSKSKKHSKKPNDNDGPGMGYNQISLMNSCVPHTSLLCTLAAIASGDNQFILTVHDVSSSPHFLSHIKSLLLLWRIPQLRPEEAPLACAFTTQPVSAVQFSPDRKASHVFAGLQDGSLLLWCRHDMLTIQDNCASSMLDLLKHMGDKQSEEGWRADSVPLLHECYNTSAMAALQANEKHHMAPIAALTVQMLLSKSERFSKSSQNTDYQLASMDSFGTICLWIVMNIARVDYTGSETDASLRPGSRWALSPMARLPLQVDKSKSDFPVKEAVTFINKPGENGRFLLGFTDGMILQQCRNNKSRIYPGEFASPYGGISAVTCLSFYPFQEDIFLAGYENGNVELFHLRAPEPLMVWPECVSPGHGVKALSWATFKPSCFFALDTNGVLFTWNLLENQYCPVKKENPQFQDDHWTGFCTNGDQTTGALWLMWSRQQISMFDPMTDAAEGDLDEAYKMANWIASLI